jgi:hypothetical protein
MIRHIVLPFVALAILPLPMANAAPATRPVAAQPLLATPDQVDGERVLRHLLTDPAIKAEQQRIKAILVATAIGQTKDGAARLDIALAEWTNSLIFKELSAGRAQPAILWGTDDTPRTWLGYTLGGVGTSGDNPDHIYRGTEIDGAGRYEIDGKFDPATRPAQFVLSVGHAMKLEPQPLTKNSADLTGQIALLKDNDIRVARDGSFRVTLGGTAEPGEANHVALEPGPLSVGFRDVLSDWRQRPARLTIRRLDDSSARASFDEAAIKAQVLRKFEPYVRFWSSFPNQWFGGLKPNSISRAVPRDGGWGYLAGLRFQLKPDEAILVTTNYGGAQYAGIQVVDPWMIAPDARVHQTSLNPAQARPDKSGNYSFVIAPRDPGVWNWLDSDGLHDGIGLLRWQNLPEGASGDRLIRDFRVIKLTDARTLPGIALATPAERKAQLARRAQEYANRTR